MTYTQKQQKCSWLIVGVYCTKDAGMNVCRFCLGPLCSTHLAKHEAICWKRPAMQVGDFTVKAMPSTPMTDS